jgi:hypothetical protein
MVPGDKRLFIAAVVLVAVPVLYFSVRTVERVTKQPTAPSLTTMYPSRGTGGFNFSGKGGKSVPAPVPGVPVAPAYNGLFTPPTIDKEWSSAIAAIMSEKVSIADASQLSPEGKWLMEAELDDDVRQARDLAERGKWNEAAALLRAVLERNSDNPYLNCVASADLCAALEALGQQTELEQEFKRLVKFMGNLPPGSGFGGRLEQGLQALAKARDSLGKAALSGESRDVIGKILSSGDVSGMSPGDFGHQMPSVLEKQFPGLKTYK